MNLIVDVGTNAEIVLGNRDRLLAASSPTGPAFEGAQISCGQRAAPGAIERVRIDPETLEPRFRVIGSDAWSDEPGFAGHARHGRLRLRDHRGDRRAAPRRRSSPPTARSTARSRRARRGSSPTAAPSRTCSPTASRCSRSRRTTSARSSSPRRRSTPAARLLLERYGIERVDRIRLAGAFGTHIDPVHALVLGLVPDCDPAHVTSAGNAAGTGARIALLDRAARAEIEDVVRRVEKIETAVEPRFQEHFVGAMAIPHDTDPYERLRAAVPLPPRRVAEPAEGDGRRRRALRRSAHRGAPHDRDDRAAAAAAAAPRDRRRAPSRTPSASRTSRGR